MMVTRSFSTEGEAAVPLPDRQSFERQLSDLNRMIETKKGRRAELEGEMGQLREERKRLRAEMTAARNRSKDLQPQIDAVKTDIDQKKTELEGMESDMIYTNEAGLNRHLKSVTEDYHRRTFHKAREENRYIEEINRLERNKKKMGQYLQLTQDKKTMENNLRSLLTEQKAVQKTYKQKQYRDKGLRKKVDLGNAELCGSGGQPGIRSQIRDLEGRRKNIIQGYDENRKKYNDWRKKKSRKPLDPSASWHGAKGEGLALRRRGSQPQQHLTVAAVKSFEQDSDVSSDEETLEPFYEEKRTIYFLLNYMQRLLFQAEESVLNSAGLDTDKGTGESSLAAASSESIPEGFTKLRKSESMDPLRNAQLSPKHHKKRSSKKKKATQAISHDAQNYKAFSQLGLSPPATYQEIPAVMDSLYGRLKFFQDQTELRDEPASPSSDIAFVYPSSESDRTTDSAWASFSMSDGDSLSLTQSEDIAFLLSPRSYIPTSPGDDQPFRLPPTTSTPAISDLEGASLSGFQRSLSDGGGAVSLATLKSVDGARLAQLRISDEGISELGSGSKDSSANSAAQSSYIQIFRQCLMPSTSTPPDSP